MCSKYSDGKWYLTREMNHVSWHMKHDKQTCEVLNDTYTMQSMQCNTTWNMTNQQRNMWKVKWWRIHVKCAMTHVKHDLRHAKREAIDDDLSSQIFKQAHVLFKAIAQWSHRLYEVAFTFINRVLQKSKFVQDVIELFSRFIMECHQRRSPCF